MGSSQGAARLSRRNLSRPADSRPGHGDRSGDRGAGLSRGRRSARRLRRPRRIVRDQSRAGARAVELAANRPGRACPPDAEGVRVHPHGLPRGARGHGPLAGRTPSLARDPANAAGDSPMQTSRTIAAIPCSPRARIADELLALPADAQARDVVHGHVARTQYVDVDDRRHPRRCRRSRGVSASCWRPDAASTWLRRLVLVLAGAVRARRGMPVLCRSDFLRPPDRAGAGARARAAGRGRKRVPESVQRARLHARRRHHPRRSARRASSRSLTSSLWTRACAG